jgi:hypothetical protein
MGWQESIKRIVWPQHLVEPHYIEGYSDQAFDLLNLRMNVELSAAAVFVHAAYQMIFTMAGACRSDAGGMVAG